MKRYLHNKTLRMWVPPISGFLFYGTWAMLINSPWLMSNGSLESAAKAALTQGSYSFVITLALALMVEWLFVRLHAIPGRAVWVFFIAVALLAVTSSGLNILAGTPNVLLTILPGLLVSAVYTGIYILALVSASHK